MTGLWSAFSRGSEFEHGRVAAAAGAGEPRGGADAAAESCVVEGAGCTVLRGKAGPLERAHRDVESGARRPEGQRRAAEAGGVSRNVLPRVVRTV